MADIQILAIGNAIMDVIAPVSDDVLASHGIAKGGMTLVDEDAAIALTGAVAGAGPVEIAGGSGANTIVGAAALGATTAYMGVVKNDEMGARFIDGMRTAGVNFDACVRVSGPATARCIIMVTPDGERSMNTFLGASVGFGKKDLDEDLIASAGITYLEGYLFDSDDAKAAFVKAAEIARAAGNKVALTLSDAFCVDRHRESFQHLVEHHIDILFANESEITSLYETDFDSAALQIADAGIIGALTRSEKGSVIIHGLHKHLVDVYPVEKVVDTTGAGDQYAAGFLAAYARGEALDVCGRWGSACAAEVISHYGARPERKITL